MTWTLFLWACLSSFSRIYLGLHFPGDILCGALWGIFCGVVCFGLMRAFAAWKKIPFYDYEETGPTLLGYYSNPDGFERKDDLFFAATFGFTLLFVAIYALL
jgi:hypothetical protein